MFDATLPNAGGGLGDQVQVGEQTAEGFDLNLFWFPADGWQILAGWSYVDTYISKDRNTANVGRNFSNNPYNRASIFASRRLAGGFTVGAGAVYTGEIDRGWADASGAQVQNDAYTIGDVFVRYEWKRGPRSSVTFALNVLNVTNEEDRGGGPWIEGRTFRFSAGVRF